MLTTSGGRAAALRVVEQSCIVDVVLMGKAHALALLMKRLESYHPQESAVVVASELESMPLAIV
jgi:hypothetical protein